MGALDPFALLGVTLDSSPVEVRNAYRELALQTHPDRSGGDGAQFRVVHDAYEFVTRNLEASVPVAQVVQRFEAFVLERKEEAVQAPDMSELWREHLQHVKGQLSGTVDQDVDPWWASCVAAGYAVLPSDAPESEEPPVFEESRLVAYSEPQAQAMVRGADIVIPRKLEDYTCDRGSDYRLAMSDPSPPAPDPRTQTNPLQAFQERANAYRNPPVKMTRV